MLDLCFLSSCPCCSPRRKEREGETGSLVLRSTFLHDIHYCWAWVNLWSEQPAAGQTLRAFSPTVCPVQPSLLPSLMVIYLQWWIYSDLSLPHWLQAQGNSGEVWHKAAWEDVIIQSISSSWLDDRPDTGVVCSDTVTHPGGGRRDSLTKQQATTAGSPSTQTSKTSTHSKESLAGYHARQATCLINAVPTEKPLEIFEQAEVK